MSKCDTEFSVRPAERSDFKAVNRTFDLVWQQEPYPTWTSMIGKYRRSGEARGVVEAGTPYDRRLAGYVFACRPDDYDWTHWLLNDVRVLPPFRKKGMGHTLMEWLKGTLRLACRFSMENKVRPMVRLDALVPSDATAYQRFLRDNGFAWTETRFNKGQESYILTCLIEPV